MSETILEEISTELKDIDDEKWNEKTTEDYLMFACRVLSIAAEHSQSEIRDQIRSFKRSRDDS